MSLKDKTHFDGILDVERFLRIAQELGLYAIVRPSPLYLCRVGMRWTPRLVDEGRAESTFEEVILRI